MTGYDAQRFGNATRIMMNIDKHQLVDAGIMHDNEGGNDWSRWNRDPLGFIARLDDPKMEKLWQLIESRQPKAPETAYQAMLEVIEDLATRHTLSEHHGELDYYIDDAKAALAKAKGE